MESMLTRSAISLRSSFTLLTLFVCLHGQLAAALDFSSGDTVTITAERGWEGEESNVIHFSGNFRMRGPDWSMTGDTAVVYGKLDDPDKILIEGSPARVSFLRKKEENSDPASSNDKVDGEALFVEYFRATDRLIMRGAASLARKESTLNSEIIEYNIDTDRYAASGEGRVNVQLNPDDAD